MTFTPYVRRGAGIAVVLVALVLPLFAPDFWTQLVLYSAAAAIGALGLTVLVGLSGQLSLAHGFFLAIGAYGYAFLGPGTGSPDATSLGLPSPLAAVLAVAAAGLAGLVFSPVAARVRGIYLGLASLALIMVGKQVLADVRPVTGGAYGRDIPVLDLFGFHFADADPYLYVLGVPFGAYDRLWYVVLALLAGCYWFLRNVLRSRVGRGLRTVRDSEAAAAAAGVDVQRYKALAFVLSSVYAGLAGVLLGLLFQHVVPEYFSLTLSVQYLAMIVIGGLGGLPGAVAGAFAVTGIPLLLTQYGGGSDTVAQYLFGALIVAVLVVKSHRRITA